MLIFRCKGLGITYWPSCLNTGPEIAIPQTQCCQKDELTQNIPHFALDRVIHCAWQIVDCTDAYFKQLEVVETIVQWNLSLGSQYKFSLLSATLYL